MKISFLDYWKYPNSFDPYNNFFLHLLRQIFENISVSDPEDADVIFSLGFGVDYTRFKDCIRIQYAGENVRPNLKSFDYSLTFDFDSYGGKNFRFPLWMMHIDWFNVGTYSNPEYLIPENYLYGDNEFTVKEKNKFCSIVFGRGVQNRIDAINTLNTYKKVDVYGKYQNCMVLPDGEKQKMNLISNYKFSICFENSIYPGYFTEKLFHAKLAGNIPIYCADEKFSEDFNSKCCINTLNMSMEEILQKVIEIDNDDKLYNEFMNQPLFLNKLSLNPIRNYFIKILK
jgi:hypothetical protein